MAIIRLTEHIDATPAEVWAALADIETHVDWMQDAVAIRFNTPEHEGVGVEFECDTRIGPIKLTDHMAVTDWLPLEAMTVEHKGAVAGSGTFELAPEHGGTTLAWEETLTFPWFLAGPVGEVFAKPIFISMWRANLRRLREKVESRPQSAS